MAEAKHTQGPLVAERAKHPDNTGGYDWVVRDQDFQIIGEFFEHSGFAGGTEKQYIIQPAEANARLFAAASDLLEALKLAIHALHEAEAILGGEYGDHYGPFCVQMMELEDKSRAAVAKAGAA